MDLIAVNGDTAVAYAWKQVDPDVVAAYPITPQTIIVEAFSEYVANGEVTTEFVCSESEHSAMTLCIGASAAGARTATASASAGLALMWEMLYIASSQGTQRAHQHTLRSQRFHGREGRGLDSTLR